MLLSISHAGDEDIICIIAVLFFNIIWLLFCLPSDKKARERALQSLFLKYFFAGTIPGVILLVVLGINPEFIPLILFTAILIFILSRKREIGIKIDKKSILLKSLETCEFTWDTIESCDINPDNKSLEITFKGKEPLNQIRKDNWSYKRFFFLPSGWEWAGNYYVLKVSDAGNNKAMITWKVFHEYYSAKALYRKLEFYAPQECIITLRESYKTIQKNLKSRGIDIDIDDMENINKNQKKSDEVPQNSSKK